MSKFVKSPLTDEMLSQFKEAFLACKLDDSQRLSPEEVEVLMRRIGLTPSQEDIKTLFDEIDQDGALWINGLTFEDFCEFASRKVKDVYTVPDILKAFANFDPDENGFINVEVLREQLTQTGEVLTPEEFDSLITAAVPDSDGNINYSEFITNIMQD